MEELISVIVPAYNIENYLARSLDSLLAQTHRNLEIIVVNDGSKDGTGAILDEYAAKDSRIKAIHKENAGVTAARLQGIAQAQGAWIGFCDGDDCVDSDMYARLLKNALEHDAVISHCGYQMVFPDGHVDYYYNSGKIVKQTGTQSCTDLLEASFVEPGLWNKLYRRELFDGLDQWIDKSIRFNEDLLMNFYLFRQAKVAVFEDFCPYHYILRKGSAATASLNVYTLKNPVTVRRILLEESKDIPEWNQVVDRHLLYHLMTAATRSVSTQKEMVKPYRRACRQELRQRLGGILRGKHFSLNQKAMALWVAIWPASYQLVHAAYARKRGTDKKYVIN